MFCLLLLLISVVCDRATWSWFYYLFTWTLLNCLSCRYPTGLLWYLHCTNNTGRGCVHSTHSKHVFTVGAIKNLLSIVIFNLGPIETLKNVSGPLGLGTRSRFQVGIDKKMPNLGTHCVFFFAYWFLNSSYLPTRQLASARVVSKLMRPTACFINQQQQIRWVTSKKE